ncbi:MAG TPA: S-layer homology domain-containing protein, partial [Acidimicrobiia bacterium]
AATGLFEDVPPNAWYDDFAETLYDQGITNGCFPDPLRYCPDDPVLRDQMASFVARALGL